MSTLLKIVTPAERDNQNVVAELKSLLEQAEKGEIVGALVVAELKTGYQYSRLNITYEHALGLASRVAHYVNQQWDRANEGRT